MVARILLTAAVVASGLVESLQAQQRQIIGEPSRDVRHTMQARKLLADDPELAAWNIGVVVNDRVAVLWGPAPSAEVAFHAELCLKAMVELVEVRNELMVSEPLEPTIRAEKSEVRPRNVPERMPPRLPDDMRWKPLPAAVLTGQVKTISAQTTTASKKPPQAILSPDTISDPDRALTAAVRVFLESKTTYGVVLFAVQDRRVYLKAPNTDSDALHEAARGVARLPNVEGVILSESIPAR
jgi:BON domain